MKTTQRIARAKRRKRTSAYERRKRTAHHEAGHAVIGRVLALPCGEAVIRRDYVSLSEGCCITPEPYACVWEWERRGKVRDTNAVWNARIIAFMAGAEAEDICLGLRAAGDGDDRYQIELMLGELTPPDREKCEARLRSMTRMLVRRHRHLIERVARALLAKRALTTEEVNTLTGRSVADVKVNAPALLFMRAQSGDLVAKARLAALERPLVETIIKS